MDSVPDAGRFSYDLDRPIRGQLRSAIGMRFSLLAHLCSQVAILIVALSEGRRARQRARYVAEYPSCLHHLPRIQPIASQR